MRTVLKIIAANTYRPLLVRYLSKPRTYRYKDIDLIIPPQVFHPGFFFSTKFLLRYVSRLPLFGKTFLELGAGSGLISIFAARKGAIVTATDISEIAVEYLHRNSQRNNVKLKIVHSDLFSSMPSEKFDFIAINPPYYKKQPLTDKDHAWFCGENGEYFSNLFSTLAGYTHAGSVVLATLCEGCDIEMVRKIAASNQLRLVCLRQQQNLLEKDYIFQIEPVQ